MLMCPDEYRVMFDLEDRYWWYRGVRTLLRAWVTQYAPRGARILDAGCGTGANLQLLQTYGDARGVDISDQAIEFCRARGIAPARVLWASVSELPFPNDFFDLAISFEVICNIADDQRALAELARVLKPGGRLIVQVPAYQWLWSRHDVAVGHQRRYAAQDVRAKLTRAGLRVERLTHANALLFPIIAARRLTQRVWHTHQTVHSDLTPLPRAVNALLSALYQLEMQVVARVDVPWGISLVALARKRQQMSDDRGQTTDDGRQRVDGKR
jgi:SAM-dependent methyltransferase